MPIHSYFPYWLSYSTKQQYVVILSVLIINVSLFLCPSVQIYCMSCSPARFKSNPVCNCYKMHNECQAGCDTFQKNNVASLTILAWIMGLSETYCRMSVDIADIGISWNMFYSVRLKTSLPVFKLLTLVSFCSCLKAFIFSKW